MRSLQSRRRAARPRLESLEGRRLLTAGALDTTFGTGGMVTSAAFNGGAGAAVAVYPNAGMANDGKVVVAGESTGGDFAVARYNADGSPDASFGKGGLATTAIGKSWDAGNAVAIQPDGKIVVAGDTFLGSTSSDWAFALVRCNPDGTLDTTFNRTGKVTTNPSNGDDRIEAMALQPDGKIVVTGSVHTNSSTTVTAVARYNKDGSLDKTFNGKGILTTSIPGTPSALAIYPSSGTANDAKIVVAGGTSNYPTSFAVVRINPNGSLDTTFGGTGEVIITTNAANGGNVYGVLIQPDGNIVAAGLTENGSPGAGGTAGDVTLIRYLGAATSINGTGYAAGSLDPTFGTGGIVDLNYRMYTYNGVQSGSNDNAHAVTMQADGKLVVAGSTAYKDASGNNVGNFLLARFDTDGSLDTTYGTNGWAETAFPGGNAGAYGIALQPDGKAVAAGFAILAGTSTNGIGIARYLGDPAATTTTLASSAEPSAYGQAVTFTATVSAASGIPTGTVEFYDGTTLLGTGTIVVVNGVATATFTISTLASGTHKIRAVYDGDANDLGSSSLDLSQVVD